MGTSLWTARCVLALALCACIPERGRAVLVLHEFVQQNETDVTLSEPLVFHFQQDLDRSSVTSRSVQIHEAGNPRRAAVGVFRIQHKRLEFEPRLPTRPDLADGGLLPGVEYVVELVGFPNPDGLRAVDGGFLGETQRLHFRTARVPAPVFASGPPGEGFLRLDPGQRSSGRIEIDPLEPIRLVTNRPVDPRSLDRGEFQLVPDVEEESPGAIQDVMREAIQLEARLVENTRQGATLELLPTGDTGSRRALDREIYDLVRVPPDPESGARDLGGRLLGFAPSQLMVQVRIHVRSRIEERGDLLDRRPHYADPSSLAQLGAGVPIDGTAHWPPGGGAAVRWPAAAGDGRHGGLDPFTGLDGETDLNASTLVLREGDVVDLGDAHGFVVLRSQGALEIAGTLRREIPGPWTASVAKELQLSSGRPRPSSEWQTLSEWLAAVRDLNEPWTVLIAGGDMRIDGFLDVEGPLLLIAGGWVRFEGRIRENPWVFTGPDGGASLGRSFVAPLRLDPPVTNPLVSPLRVALMTEPFRPLHGVAAWRASDARTLGGGSSRVFFRGLRDRGETVEELDRFAPVEDLSLLGDCEAIQLICVLEVPAGQGEPWNPPALESVKLSWRAP